MGMRAMSEREFAELLSPQTVYVTVPAEVAFDLERIQSVQKDILGRLGCQACCSGFDIRFDVARRFIVDADLRIQPIGTLG